MKHSIIYIFFLFGVLFFIKYFISFFSSTINSINTDSLPVLPRNYTPPTPLPPKQRTTVPSIPLLATSKPTIKPYIFTNTTWLLSHINTTCRLQSQSKFFDAIEKKGRRPRIGMISVPRSGSSMTRILMERATGIWTGGIIYDHLLFQNGFYGEGIFDERVSAIKYHAWPDQVDGLDNLDGPEYKILNTFEKIIYIIRNPLDVLLSFENYLTTRQHNKTIHFNEEKLLKRFRRWNIIWRSHIRVFIRNLDNESRLLLPDGQYRSVIVVRYEDLVNPSDVVKCFYISNENKKYCTEFRFFELFRVINFLEINNFTLPLLQKLDSQALYKLPKIPASDQKKFRTFKQKNFTSSDFITIASELKFEESVLCPFKREKKNGGYTVRKKEYNSSSELLSIEGRTEFFSALREEICLLGYFSMYKNFMLPLSISCDDIPLHPVFVAR